MRIALLLSLMINATPVLSPQAFADQQAFSQCMKDTLKKFGESSISADIMGIIKQVGARSECYRLLEPSDPIYKQVQEDRKLWTKIHEIARQCGGCNI